MKPDRYRATERALFADAGIEPTEQWHDLAAGTCVRVLEHGTGAPVLFLHGGPNAAATWAYVAAATRGVRCVLLDRPGCGLSEPPATVPDNVTVAAYVAELSATSTHSTCTTSSSSVPRSACTAPYAARSLTPPAWLASCSLVVPLSSPAGPHRRSSRCCAPR